MTTTTSDTEYRPQEIDESSVIRYLLATFGAAGLGLGASLVIRRPHRAILGGGLIAGGAALLVRGIRGQWPALFGGRGKAIAGATTRDASPLDQGWNENEGEGSRSAARHYNAEVREFIDEGRVKPAARSAARAVDGPEGAALREAEERAKLSPSNGRH